MKDTCLSCGKEVEIDSIFIDELGSHCICPECGSSFNISAEIIPERNTEGLVMRGNYKLLGCDYKPIKHKDVGVCVGIGSHNIGLETVKALSRLGHNPVLINKVNVIPEYETDFNQYMFGERLLMSMYSEYSRKKTIPDQLKELGITSFAKLKAEWFLIKNKQSNHNRTLRDAIEKAYEVVTKPKL